MQLVVAWEDFLEQAFIRYLTGAGTPSGRSVKLRIGPAVSLDHAYQVLAGKPDYNSAANFIIWNKPAEVLKRASVFYNGGGTFADGLKPHEKQLLWATNIRNRVAHASTKSKTAFKTTSFEMAFSSMTTKLPKAFRPAALLAKPADRHFGQQAKQQNWSIFQAYCVLYRQAAKAIAP